MPNVPPAHPVHISGGHFIERHRNNAHIIAPQQHGQHPLQLLAVHGHIPQHGGELLECITHQRPQPLILRRCLLPSGGIQCLASRPHTLGEVNVLHKRRQRHGLFLRRDRRMHTPLQRFERLAHRLPPCVQCRQLLLGGLVHHAAIALRV